MTAVFTAWLVLQFPAGILLGRILHHRFHQPAFVPATLRRGVRR